MTNAPQAALAERRSAPLTESRYVVPLVLITTLFFLWALGVNLNDILIPHLKAAFGLTDFQSSFIQIAFFGGYFLAAFPAGWLMERIGYKKGILIGLLLCATGALLFLPAASSKIYGFFLFSLFVMACGQSFLEVAANPYVTTLGPPESAERRLNLTQSFNAVGAVLTPIIGAAFILTATEYTAAQLAQLTPAQLEAYRAAQVSTVRVPYLVIAGIFLAVAVLIYFTHLPDVREQADSSQAGNAPLAWSKVLGHYHLIRGVLAQFLYVGAQVGVASFVIRFAQHVEPGISAKDAANYLKLHIFGFMIGRFVGSAVMKRVAPPHLLALFAGCSLVCAMMAVALSGFPSVFAIVLLGFFHSIIGGAICPALMGRISDLSNIQRAFFIPLLCYAYVLFFALSGYKPHPASLSQTAMEMPSK